MRATYTPPPKAEGTVTLVLTEQQARDLLVLAKRDITVPRFVFDNPCTSFPEKQGVTEGSLRHTLVEINEVLTGALPGTNTEIF